VLRQNVYTADHEIEPQRKQKVLFRSGQDGGKRGTRRQRRSDKKIGAHSWTNAEKKEHFCLKAQDNGGATLGRTDEEGTSYGNLNNKVHREKRSEPTVMAGGREKVRIGDIDTESAGKFLGMSSWA